MTGAGIRRTLVQIVAGYFRSFRRIAWSLLLLAATLGVSAAIVFPLWYFSTHERKIFTIVVLCLLAAGILFLLFRRTRAFWELSPNERAARFRRLALRLMSLFAYLVALYVILGLYVVGLLAAALPLTMIYLLVLGYSLYVRKSRTRR